MTVRQLPATHYKRLKAAFRNLYRECGGTIAAAQATRLCKSQIHDCGNADKPDFPALDVVADLEAECGKPVVTEVLFALHEEHERPHRPGDPLERVSSLAKETGEACWEFHAYHQRPSPNAATQALKELQEARDALDAAMKDIEADMERTANLREVG